MRFSSSPQPSPERRGSRVAQLSENPNAVDPREARHLFLPLPRGEGWGEGERRSTNLGNGRTWQFAFLIFFAITASALAQDRLKTMPGYERFERISRESTNAFKSGALSVTWTNGGAAFEFQRDGKRFR